MIFPEDKTQLTIYVKEIKYIYLISLVYMETRLVNELIFFVQAKHTLNNNNAFGWNSQENILLNTDNKSMETYLLMWHYSQYLVKARSRRYFHDCLS
jgi:hypothetical protein